MFEEVTGGDAQWGVAALVAEPATDKWVNGASVKLGSGQVGGLSKTQQREWSAWPGARDWCVYVTATRETEGDPVFRRSPSAEVTLGYGTGSANNDIRQLVPPQGLALHVTAQWVRALVRINKPALGTPADVMTEVTIVPGAPQTTTMTQRVEYNAPGDLIDVMVPPFATGLAALTVYYVDNLPLPIETLALSRGVWGYKSPVDATFAAIIGQALPLTSQGALVTTLRVSNQGVHIPFGANAVRLAPPEGAVLGGVHYLQWEVQA